MARVLSVGIATLDIINQVAAYPDEDAEIRALSQSRRRGGNAANTAVVLSQLGHQADWAGVLIDENDSALIQQDLAEYQIGTQYCRYLPEGKMPTSYITLSAQTGSRTIVHVRDCPEFSFVDFQQIDLTQYDWLHFEGRNIAETAKMLVAAKQFNSQLSCSVEVEKPRENIEMLFDQADFLMFSHHYAIAKGFQSASTFLEQLTTTTPASCSWGAEGVWAKTQQQLIHQSAFVPEQIIDTLGAGDCLNAGLIQGLLQHADLTEVLAFASRLAGIKCGQSGFAGLQCTVN